MGYIQDSLSDGETVEHLFSLHWLAWVPFWLYLLISPMTLGLSLVVAIYDFIRLKSVEQGVTNKRVVYKTGWISRHSDEMRLTSIETVEIDQGILGRILGFGSVKVTGRGISDLLFKGVDDPLSVKRKIEGISNPIG